MRKVEKGTKKIDILFCTLLTNSYLCKQINVNYKHKVLMKKTLLALTIAALACSLGASAQNRVKNVYTESKTLKVEQVANLDQPVQLNRYLFAGYNTLCLPMTVSGEQLATYNVRAERLAAIRQEGSTLCLYFVECTNEGLEAGMPYLIFSPTKQYLRLKNTDAMRSSQELKTVRMSDGQGNQVAFSSSWELKQKEGLYGIPAKQNVEILESVLMRTTKDQSFLPTRCGFNWEQQANGAETLEIRHATQAEVTAISEKLNSDGFATSPAYDLNGRQVTTQRGIIIQNGKKIVK